MNETINSVFPGAEPWVPTEPSKRICILRDLVVHVTFDSIGYVHHVDSEGIETDVDNPLDSGPVIDRDYRIYACTNCGWQTSGEETFEVARAHLGKRNPYLHPFADNL